MDKWRELFNNEKNNLLLNKNWILQLPNSKFIDFSKSSAYFYDFGIFNEGKEMPWGLSQLIFYYDSDKLKIVPKSASQLKNFIKRILADLLSSTTRFYRNKFFETNFDRSI